MKGEGSRGMAASPGRAGVTDPYYQFGLWSQGDRSCGQGRHIGVLIDLINSHQCVLPLGYKVLQGGHGPGYLQSTTATIGAFLHSERHWKSRSARAISVELQARVAPSP